MLADSLFDILRAYATLQSPKTIKRSDISFSALHAFLLDHVLLNPHFEEFPPSKQYQAVFWKWAIDWLEQLASDEDEIDERVFTHHIDLIQALSSRGVGAVAPSSSYVTYLWPTKTPPARPVYPGYASATLLESRTTIEGGTTGLRTWSASLVLAQFLLAHSELVRGKRVLELGCGAGFLGIVTASIQIESNTGTSALWLTDVHEPVLQRCEANIGLRCNQSHEHPNLHLRTLDWFDAADAEQSSVVYALFDEAKPDVILGADVVYDPSIIPPLVNILALALATPGNGSQREAYIALTQRNEDTLADFLRQAEERLAVETIATERAADNVFTGSADLGQCATGQTVKIFKLLSKV